MSLLVVELLLLFDSFFSFHVFATDCLYTNHSENFFFLHGVERCLIFQRGGNQVGKRILGTLFTD